MFESVVARRACRREHDAEDRVSEGLETWNY
jgi:hypothetical protein